MKVCLVILALTLVSAGLAQQPFYNRISSLAGCYNWGSSWWTPYQWYRYANAMLIVDYTQSLAHPTYLNAILACSQQSCRSTIDLYIDTLSFINLIPSDSWVYTDGGWQNWKERYSGSYYVGRVVTPLGGDGYVLVSFNIESWIRAHPNSAYYITLDQNGDDWDAIALQVWLGPEGEIGLSEAPSVPAYRREAEAVPNPTSLPVSIRYHLHQPGRVEVKIYDVQGRMVRALADQHSEPGTYSLTWDGTDANRVRVAAGRYFYRLESPDQVLKGSVVVGKCK